MAETTVQYLPDYTYSQVLTAGHHAFLADEPEAAGGDDLGPGPYELLLWALGSCTAMTLLIYARRKGWDVADVSVHLTHDRVHAEDAGVEGGSARVDVIKRDISIRGRLSDEQRQRLLEIAGRCPVARTIASAPKIVDSMIVGE